MKEMQKKNTKDKNPRYSRTTQRGATDQPNSRVNMENLIGETGKLAQLPSKFLRGAKQVNFLKSTDGNELVVDEGPK